MLDTSLLQEIEDSILSQGELSKQDIIGTWELDDAGYHEARNELLSRGAVTSGPKRTGGLVAKRKRDHAPTGETPRPILTENWEVEVVTYLMYLFQHVDLEKLLGPLVYTVRTSRVAMTGEDRRGTKQELATALVLQHGIDLLANEQIRFAVAKACKIKAPQRWHPGGPTATEFVAKAGLPSLLAGLPREDTAPPYEYLEGRFTLRPLEDFQREVSAAMTGVIKSFGEPAIVSLPTGAGKTRVAVESIRDWLTELYDPVTMVVSKGAVLWLAHTEELCEQAYACFKQVWEASTQVAPLLLVRFWGRYTQDLERHRDALAKVLHSPCVLISTPQRIVNLLKSDSTQGRTVVADLRKSLGTLVIDEAHRAAAPTYKTILDALAHDGVPVVGLTATPFRMEYDPKDQEAGTKELRKLFPNLIEPTETLGDSIREVLQERGVLAQPQFQTIETKVPMRMPSIPNPDEPTSEDLERIDHALKIRADQPRRRIAVLEHVVRLAKEPANSILYFGPSVGDAECMAYLLRERGIRAAVVSANTRDVTRRNLIEQFRQNKLSVLCNCEVLTTGFDAPKVSHVVVARPTVSQVLYEQMVGRGLRGPKFGGTKTCVILDCEDSFRGEVRPQLGYTRFRKVWRKG
jgi:DNA repair protein RadD